MALSLGELKKRAGRIDTFINMWSNGTPFVFEDGNSRQIISIILDKTTELDIRGLSKVAKRKNEQIEQAKLAIEKAKTAEVLANDNKKYSFRKLAKTKEFGGTGGTSKTEEITKVSGGVITEVLSETGFCFYYALLVNGKLDSFNKESFKTVGNKREYLQLINDLGLTKQLSDGIKDEQIEKYIKIMYQFLGTGWDEILRAQVKKFKSTYNKAGSSYYMTRSPAIPDAYNPYATYRAVTTVMQKKYNFDKKIGEDKWNPADLWIYNDAAIKRLTELNTLADKLRRKDGDEYKISLLDMVNEEIYELYKEGICFPVSLKKSSLSPHVDEINVKGETEKITTLDKVELSQGNIDVKFHFTLKVFQGNKLVYTNNKLRVKMKAGASGGFRLEIEGGKDARFGSMGSTIYTFIIKETDDSGLKVLEKIRNDVKESNENLKNIIPSMSDKMWFGGPTYMALNKDVKNKKLITELVPYLQQMYEKVNGKGEKFNPTSVKTGSETEKIYNKTSAAELAIAVGSIVNKYSRDIVVENLVDAASSARLSAGIRPEQIEARKKQLGGKIDDDFKTLPTNMAKLVFTSCFHLKIS